MTINSRKAGRFSIPHSYIDERPEEVKKVMAQCIVTRAESEFCSAEIRYTAISNQFDDISFGDEIPYYTWYFNDDGSLNAIRKK